MPAEKLSELKMMDNTWISIDQVWDAYRECRKNKKDSPDVIEFEIGLIENIVQLWHDINEKHYSISKSITFIVGRPKAREVFAGNFRDRIVHHLIMSKLEPIFESIFISNSFSCRKGKGVLYGIETVNKAIQALSQDYTKPVYVGKFDLKGFFMSIDKVILATALKTLIKERYHEPDIDKLQYLVRKVIEHNPQSEGNYTRKGPDSDWDKLSSPDKSLFTCKAGRGLPIGNLTSQCFANFCLNSFDHEMCKLFKGYYFRYVDDFIVLASTKEEITRQVKYIERYLSRKLHLTLHPKKRYIQDYKKGFTFIGYHIKKGKVRLGNRALGHLYDAIHRFNALTPTPELAEEFATTLNSYFGFLKYSSDRKMRLKVWGGIDKKWKGIIHIDHPTISKVWIPKNMRALYIRRAEYLEYLKGKRPSMPEPPRTKRGTEKSWSVKEYKEKKPIKHNHRPPSSLPIV